MKKLYIRFALLLVLMVFISTFVATGFAFLIGNFVLPYFTNRGFGMAMWLRDLLIPILTLVSSSLLISFTSKRAVAPIIALSAATRQVAQGDFDIQIKDSNRKDEIGVLERNFNLMVKELKSNEFMKKDFIANVSHEFKTPLAIIQGYGKLLNADDLPEQERREYANTIQQESRRLLALTTNILRLSKLDNQAFHAAATRFSLDEQLRQAVLLLAPKWNEKNIGMNVELEPCEWMGDEELLWEVWINLIDNAIKFSNESGAIFIALRQTEEGVQVLIRDGGAGMDEETKSHIFDPFFQGDTSLSQEGSGLGLPIAKRVAMLHGGFIEVESAPGKGTQFAVTLPVAQE